VAATTSNTSGTITGGGYGQQTAGHQQDCRVRPGDMEQLPCQTADFISVYRDICKKTQVISSADSTSWTLYLIGAT